MRSGNFAGERAFAFPVDVLRSDRDGAAVRRGSSGCQ